MGGGVWGSVREEGMVWIIRKSGGYLSSKGILSEEVGGVRRLISYTMPVFAVKW